MDKIIRYKDKQFFFTKDNWKKFEVLKSFVNSAEEEQNSDLVVSVRLRYELGEKRAKVILEELEKIRKCFNLPKKDGYGHAFEIFAISTLYNLDYSFAYDNYIVKGSGDGKIDAIYWKDQEKIEIYQIKLDNINENDIKIMKKNHNDYCRKRKVETPNSGDLQKFYELHSSNIDIRKNLIIKTISNNGTKNNIKPKEIFELYFTNQLIVKNNNIELLLQIPNRDNALTTIPDNTIYAYFDLGKNVLNSIMSCDQIRTSDNLYKLFFDNVRGQLKTNKSMKKTIEKEEENFVLYNNGITITGDVDFHKETNVLIIKNPVISNGQQTVWNLLENKEEIQKTAVLVIVKNNSDPIIKSKIARYTNEQKTIKAIDLLSLDESLRVLQKDLYISTDYFLELNSSGTKNYTKIIKKIYEKNNIIPLKDFCRVYYSSKDKRLGDWKNNVSDRLTPLLDAFNSYDFEFSKKVCNIIKRYKDFLLEINDEKEKNDMQSADLAFMYVMLKYDKSEEETANIINKINKDYFYDKPSEERKSKLIDLYKSNDIVKIIEGYCK